MRVIPTGRGGATGPAGPQGPPGFASPAYGEEIITNNAVAITLTNQNQFYPVNTGWANDDALNCVQDAVNGTLAPTVSGEYLTICTVVFTSAGLQQVEFQLFKNGVAIPDHKAISWVDTAIFPNTVTISGIDGLVGGDVISLKVRCTSAAGLVITVTDANMSVVKVAP